MQVLSTTSSTPFDEVAHETDAPKWFQLYCDKTVEGTDERIERAAANGFKAIAITVDTPVLGVRYKGLGNLAEFASQVAGLQKMDVVDRSVRVNPYRRTPHLRSR